MASTGLGRTLVIANPNAQSGRGESAALFVVRFFSSYHFAAVECVVHLTEGQGDARDMAAMAQDFDTVVALGGDGVVHEVANGLMELDTSVRPRLGVIPMGPGNDFARTLGISKNDPERAIKELLSGHERTIDLGFVNDTYFCQSLSFGLDAAIVLDTNARKARNTHPSGSGVYMMSGIRLVAKGSFGWPYHAVVDGVEYTGPAIAFAVQNGPTYGGGFRICPDASPTDGELDLCMSVSRAIPPEQMALFGLIRLGRHTHSRHFAIRRFRELEVTFPEEAPPCQADSEPIEGTHFMIRVVPQALRVICPAAAS